MADRDETYWSKRVERQLNALEAMTQEEEESIEKALQQAQREVENEIERFCRRYACRKGVTYAEAQKALSLTELQSFQGRLEEFKQLALQHKGQFSLEVEELSIKARITRYQAIKVEIDAVLQRLYTGLEKGMGASALRVYDDQYHRTLFELDQYAGFRHPYVGIDTAAIKQVMQYPFNGLDYSTRLWRQQEDLAYQLRTVLGTMLVTGEPPEKYTKEFAQAFQVKRQEAARLLYTEHAYVAEQAKFQGYRDTGVKKYEILATLDQRTSEICQEQDGKRYQLEDAVVGKTCPPFHPWCRTVTVPVVQGLNEVMGQERTARDPGTGKTISVPASMTYQQWKTGLQK